MYVTLPGSLERPIRPNGTVSWVWMLTTYAFVKRIHAWDCARSMRPEDNSAVTASPATNMLHLAARGRLGAIDLATDKMVWTITLCGKCCSGPICRTIDISSMRKPESFLP